MIFSENVHHLLRLGRLSEGSEPSKVKEHNGYLAPVSLERVVRAAANDQLGKLRRKETLEPPESLDLGDLLLNALLKHPVPLGKLVEVPDFLVAQPLLFEARADARTKEYRVEGLRKVVLRSPLDAPHDARDLVESRNHDNGDVTPLAVGLQVFEHLVPIHLRHHHIEEYQVNRLGGDPFQGLMSAFRRRHIVSLLLETTGKHVAVVFVVVHNEQAAG
jgi:hypothetical protein